jgi:molybdenum cofactor cytidylyltransferase
MLGRILATLREHPLAATVVVLGHGADVIEAGLSWADEVRVHNPAPQRGISSSLKVGFDALRALPIESDGAFVVLGDQPELRVTTLRALASAAAEPAAADRSFFVPIYADDAGPRNPVLVRRAAWSLIGELDGDQGLGPFLARHPERCLWLPIDGTMPDVDTPADLEVLRATTQP